MEQDPRNENFNSYENNSQPYRPTVIIGERNPDQKSSNLAVTSLVLGILSIIFCIVFYISVIMGLIGLILGIVSVAQHRDGRGLAIAGIITNGIGLVLGVIIGFLAILGTMMMM
ncbi:MAG: DUF4190 domain-containing protein [Lachnospiraceae bacterium]|nr:DUF4190 domain-containing protein [Lachnospiraceae bacterium]